MAIDIHRRGDFYNVFWIAWPQALSTLVMTIQSLVDIFWIGRLGTEEVAAVALTGNVIFVLFGLSTLLHAGAIALLSRAMGADKPRDASHTLVHSFLLGVVMGIALLVLCWFPAPWIIGFFKAEPEVTRLAVIYLRIMGVHMAGICVIIAPFASFASAGDTITPLVINTIAVVTNAILDPIFIFSPGQAVEIAGMTIYPGVFGWGVFGAGLATVVAVGLALILCFLTVPMGRFPVKVPRFGEIKIELFEFWRIIKIGAPFAIAHISRPMSTVLLLRIIAAFGTGAVAGFGIAMRWYSVNWILFGGMGMAASVLVGQHLGAESPERASRVSGRLIAVSLATQILLTALYWYLAPYLVAAMDPNPMTVKPGADFMRWVVLGFLISSPGGIAASAMNGAGDTMPGMIAGIISNWAIKLPLAWALAQISYLGLIGVWHAMFISLFAEGAICLVWYRLGKWKLKKLGGE